MPSENKTPNLGLNQWQGHEYAKRQDFVEDNQKIDTAFGNLEDLTTEEKSDLVGAINEIDNTVKAHQAETIEDDVHGLYTRLGDLRIINFTLNSNSSVKLKFPFEGVFMCLLLIRGTLTFAYGAFVLQGYGAGGTTRYHVGEIQKGSYISISVDAEGERSFTVSSTATVNVTCSIVMFFGSPPEIIY